MPRRSGFCDVTVTKSAERNPPFRRPVRISVYAMCFGLPPGFRFGLDFPPRMNKRWSPLPCSVSYSAFLRNQCVLRFQSLQNDHSDDVPAKLEFGKGSL
jgi:hypothetical protein